MSTFIDGNLDRARALYLLTMQDAATRGLSDHWPRARWCKFRGDDDGVYIMVFMNRTCAERFYSGCSPYRVIGHCDRQCHSDEMAAHYAATDREAVERAGEIVECDEPVEGGGTVRVLKFAFRVDSDALKGWFVYGECAA